MYHTPYTYTMHHVAYIIHSIHHTPYTTPYVPSSDISSAPNPKVCCTELQNVWYMMLYKYSVWCMIHDVMYGAPTCMILLIDCTCCTNHDDVWCMVYGVWCIVYGVWCMVYNVWCVVYACMVHGAWCMVHDVWYMVCMVHGVCQYSQACYICCLMYSTHTDTTAYSTIHFTHRIITKNCALLMPPSLVYATPSSTPPSSLSALSLSAISESHHDRMQDRMHGSCV
jgi:hypothetical protein